ncbi:hypothetical protein MATL_G00043460 [Megalops atlanticus]|uniref:Delta-like protein n=1 Tax=Megalops atlanticus TaxID=7932 RepID=A0A9D3QAP8_MEGAT|nr:hypothetical protein MATL_G00043460 [Megalops atlanticus]
MKHQVKGQQWPVILLVAIALQSPGVSAVGVFELQIRQVQNFHGRLQSGECCDLPATEGQRCAPSDPCDTFFRACLKEYQARVAPTGPCTFGSGSTGVLGGNTFSLHHHALGGVKGGGGAEGDDGRIIIPFKYAWPKSFSLVLEVLDHDNETAELGQEELIERVLVSSMLNPGEQWQVFRHHGRHLSLEYRLRFRCEASYYGPLCNVFCRARDDFFGHFTCDAGGGKVCAEGWTGPECRQAVCRQGCHQVHGYCSLPGECECQYGWQGPLCDQCVTFPGCVHGSCTEPWKCMCDTNWGGLLCDKDLNYCGTHQPCKNGGTCANTEPNEYQCVCQEGFRGRNCDIVEHACQSAPCANGGVCMENSSGFSCVCADGWTGHTCASAVLQCSSSPCAHGATCWELLPGFECLCPHGWTGRTCQLGGYSCDCAPGWMGQNCDIRNSSCHGDCMNGGHCEETASGFQCQCLLGFSGKYCQMETSVCDSAPCLHGGLCVEQEGGTVLCHCPSGYMGVHCEVCLSVSLSETTSCAFSSPLFNLLCIQSRTPSLQVVMDQCKHSPCSQGVPCSGLEGGYECVCPEGHTDPDCTDPKDPCQGEHCRGAMFSPGGGSSVHTVLVGVLVLVVAGGLAGLVLLLSRLCTQHRKQQLQGPAGDQGSNNQRDCVTLIRNLDRAPPLSPPRSASPIPCCYEEIELTLPPTPTPTAAASGPGLKPAHIPKLDLSNREREKLNRIHYPEGQELEV